MPDYISSATVVSEIVRAFKAAAMYPEGHPGRKRFFDRLFVTFTNYLKQSQVLEIRIEDGAVQVGDQPASTGDGTAEFLARECFLRQIAAVRFLQGVREEDLNQFFHLLAMDPEVLRDAGGALEVVRSKVSGGFQVDQVDYAGILEKRMETSGEDGSRYVTKVGAPLAVPEDMIDQASRAPSFSGTDEKEVSQEEWLDNKLGELDEAQTEALYKSVLRDILVNIKTTESLNLPVYSAHVLKRLAQHLLAGGAARNPVIIRAAIRDLAKPGIVEELAAQLTLKDQPQRENIQAVFHEVKDISIPVLLNRLAEEEEAYGRGAILNALEGFGEAVRPHLEKWLHDERWYVVRNAIGLLQQVGSSRDSTSVRDFLDHPNSKVRLEALRFLYRHPVHVSEERMERLLEDRDPEVQARAVYALGVLLGPKGLRRLRSLARKPFLGEGDVAMREMAVKGIGRQGGQEAISFLVRLVTKRSFLRPARGERIRKAAISALFEMDEPVVVNAVRKLVPKLKGETLRTAEEYIRRIEGKGNQKESAEEE